MAALKKRRKKFSNSRNASPILDPPSADQKAAAKILKRASSFPARVTTIETEGEEEEPNQRHEQTQSQQESVDTTIEHQITPSTTEESVAGNCTIKISSTEPLLCGPIESLKNDCLNGQQRPLPNLPNIIPIRGHLQQQGWL